MHRTGLRPPVIFDVGQTTQPMISKEIINSVSRVILTCCISGFICLCITTFLITRSANINLAGFESSMKTTDNDAKTNLHEVIIEQKKQTAVEASSQEMFINITITLASISFLCIFLNFLIMKNYKWSVNKEHT